MEYAILIAPAAALLALCAALFFARRVLKMPEEEGAGRIADLQCGFFCGILNHSMPPVAVRQPKTTSAQACGLVLQ